MRIIYYESNVLGAIFRLGEYQYGQCEDWSDERLLEVAKGCEVAFGYGVIAEICKRLKERAHE